MNLSKIFKKNGSIIIGVIHFPPLLGYKDFPGFDVALSNALADLKAFENGGVDGVIFENNYDIPHREFVASETAHAMMRLGKEIKSATTLPLGVSVLWNDYKTALSIAKGIGGLFVRVPVFVDTVETDYGVVKGDAQAVAAYRKEIKADNVALFTDIHVKHSKLLSLFPIEESAGLAIKNGSDGLIVTGAWTGKAPDIQRLESVRNTAGNFPIFAGSGADRNNIKDLLRFANGVIVSTSVKFGEKDPKLVNAKSYERRIDVKKVRELVNCAAKK